MVGWAVVGGDWFDAANWIATDRNGGAAHAIPGEGADAVLSGNPGDSFIPITYDGTDRIDRLALDAERVTLDVNGGALALGNGGSVETLNLAEGAALSIEAGTLSVDEGGIFAGSVSGAGTLALAKGVFFLDAGVALTVGTLDLGTVTYGAHRYGSSTFLDTSLGFANRFALDAGASLYLDGYQMTLGGAAALRGTISGPGTLILTGGAGDRSCAGLTVQDDAVLDVTAGATIVQNGDLRLAATPRSPATLEIDAGATYRIGAASAIMGVSGAAGATLNNGILIDLAGGTSEIDGPITNNGTIETGQGAVLRIMGATGGTGGMRIDGGSTLELGAPVAAGQGVTFAGAGATLKLDAAGGFAAAIAGFAAGDVVDLVGEAVTTVTLSGGTASVTLAGGATQTFALGGGIASLLASSDGAGGTAITGSALPALSIDPAATFTSGRTATLTGHVLDAVSAAAVELFDGDVDLGAAAVDGDGTWTFTKTFGSGDFASLRAVATDAAGASTAGAAPYELVTGITGEPYRAQEFDFTPGGGYGYTDYDRRGTALVRALDNGDGTHTITSVKDGQVLASLGNDVLTGGGARERFVFSPGFGQDEVMDFALAGLDHDTIDLSNTRFSTLAQVLRHTTMGEAGAVVHLNPHDAITLDGVTKAQIATHPKDFAFA